MTRIAAVAADAPRPQHALRVLRQATSLVPPREADVLVVLGGDGTLIDAVHGLLDPSTPDAGCPAVYGANFGTTGFLMNDGEVDDLLDRVGAAVPTRVRPLRFRVQAADGATTEGYAFNEVALRRSGNQVARLRVLVDGEERLPEFKGDGILVATPVGSTGYNVAAGGPVLPLDAGLLALTPICPLRPRRWRGALLPRTGLVRVEVLDAQKRPVAASGDQRALHPAVAVEVQEDPSAEVVLLFDPGRTLQDRSLAEQFAG